jgi:two-component system, chemotaxis family, response regulator Rcp1
VFRILIVDDSPADVVALREVLTQLRRPYQVNWVQDGSAALDFLYRRGVHQNAKRPELILMDLHMPRVAGLEALTVIKSDPRLSVIPTIVLSSSISSSDVRRSYELHANAFVQKPSSLKESAELIRGIEAFWADLAVQPTIDDKNVDANFSCLTPSELSALSAFRADSQWQDGGHRAIVSDREETTPVMESSELTTTHVVAKATRSGCKQHQHLLDEFGAAVREVLRLHEDQFRAIIEGDSDSSRFDLLIHLANEKKQRAKYEFMRHMESHDCCKER